MARPAIPRGWLTGPGLTLAGLVATEVAKRTLPAPAPAVVLLLTLTCVAYAGLRGGFGPGLLSVALISLYTIRFTSEEAFVTLDATTIQSAGIMLILATALVLPMALIGRREERLRRALEERAREVERRNAELTEANAALEAFGYVVSHDLKEPVRAIENYLDAAREGYGTPEGREDLAKAAEANGRLVRLLQGLLTYSRASSMTPNLRVLDVREVIEGETCRTQYEALLRERGGTLEIDPAIPPVLGDEVILAQLFGNLILNAVRHNPGPAPRVRVRGEEEGRFVHLVVEDDGPGFPPDVVERFRKLRGSRPATLRAGFGLVISQRAAQRLGGSMDLETIPGGGRVHLRLPGPQAKR